MRFSWRLIATNNWTYTVSHFIHPDLDSGTESLPPCGQKKKPWDIPQRGKHLAATSYGEISDPKKMETPKVMFHHFSSLFKSRSRLQLVNIGGTNQEFRTAFLELKGKTSDPFIFGLPSRNQTWLNGWLEK